MRFGTGSLAVALVAGVLMTAGARAEEERDLFDEAPWYTGGGVGLFWYEGDQQVDPSPFLGARLGYDHNAFFSTELGLNLAPQLKDGSFKDPNRDKLDHDIWGIGLSVDEMLHLRNANDLHWDPYLSVGGALVYYEDMISKQNPELALQVGAGLIYHLNDVWAVRFDFRSGVAGSNTEFNQTLYAGVDYRWGAVVKPQYSVGGGDIDSDGDGLLDSEEATIGTDPFNPDTDGDGLSDGEEHRTYKTNPLNPDTDWDALKDGAEVLTYKTNPLDPDTDKGGVSDGHEVIEDNTDPLNPADDLQLFALNIEFDYDKADLRSQYYNDLDKIVKVLQRAPGASARVEGHADKRKRSQDVYNKRLSERRARAVMEYLITVGGIERSRLTSLGYGFSRPVAPNDSEANMQKNRRTEIYIRPSGKAEVHTTSDVDMNVENAQPVSVDPDASSLTK